MNSIKFILNKKAVSIDLSQGPYGPTTTVLEYLRSQPHLKGVKEGCAEGDCGACTLVLGELQPNGEVCYRNFDSCLVFLPMLHGKELITVEGIGDSSCLHPVQQAMVDTDGSQCGYCTPGFIMSMYYLYNKNQKATKEDIKDCLTGNLCRCTGYRSIMAAAEQSCVQEKIEHNSLSSQSKELLESMEIIDLAIDTNQQSYYQPRSLDSALSLLASKPNAQIVNGATDLGLAVTKQKALLESLIDISCIAKLKEIDIKKEGVEYGAGVNLEDLRLHCADYFPALQAMLNVFGSRQIRYLGTLGGNIASASPIGDMPPVLMAYEAVYTLVSQSGERKVDSREFVTGYRQTLMKENELIKSIFIPFPKENHHLKSYKISKRKDLDISTVSAGFQLKLKEGLVEDIALVYGGMAAQTKRADNAEAHLRNKAWTRTNVEEAMSLLSKDFTPISDARSGEEGRKLMARNLLLKFWNETQYE